MLRVTVEVVPGGDEDRAREIMKLEIWNVGGPEHAAEYHWEARMREADKTYNHDSDSSGGGVVFHARHDGAICLVKKVLGLIPEVM
jgi:hypothetical protein